MRLKEKSKESCMEESFGDGIIIDEFNTAAEIIHPITASTLPFQQRRIKLFEYEFLKTYLYAIYTKAKYNEEITVVNYNALASDANPVIVAPKIAGTDSNGLAIIENRSVFVNLIYKGCPYQCTVFVLTVQEGAYHVQRYYISVLGSISDSNETITLTDVLIRESIKNSYYRNKILSIMCDREEGIDIKEIPAEKFSDEKLENIFVPSYIKNELIRFHQCVKNYDAIGSGLRYLLCGEPGTGKTKSIRTLVNQCYGKATIILAEGMMDFKAVFEFARMFEPSIICIDDVDLLVGNRDRIFSPSSLGALLQELDGFNKNNIFLLATTNDKDLIDRAASRPGRFDMVIDYNKISSENYLELISSNCSIPEVLEVIDESVIGTLRRNKITGAYLVNMIKQLEIKFKLEPDCDLKDYVKDLIKYSYKGFYKRPDESQISFGFNSDNGTDIMEL